MMNEFEKGLFSEPYLHYASFNAGYRKAIDDFEKSLKDYFVIPHDVRVIEMKAEQLKVGANNDD